MKVNSRVGAAWAVTVFVVIGLVLILVAVLNGGDDADMEDQPTSLAGLTAAAVAPAPAAG